MGKEKRMERLEALTRKRFGKQFRRKLGQFNYKVKKHGIRQINKKPGVIPLDLKVKLLENGTQTDLNRIKELERKSYYPYGKWTKTGKFIYDESKTMEFNVPDLTDFPLGPYVAYNTPKVPREQIEELQNLNDFYDEKNFGRYADLDAEERGNLRL